MVGLSTCKETDEVALLDVDNSLVLLEKLSHEWTYRIMGEPSDKSLASVKGDIA